VRDRLLLEDAVLRQRADAAVGERRRHDGHLLARDLEGAVHEVALQRLDQVGAGRERGLLRHHVAEAEVARRCGALAHVRAVLEADPAAAREPAPDGRHVVEARVLCLLHLDERGRHDGASVDEGVVRDALRLLEHRRVERAAVGLVPDVPVHGLLAVQLGRHAVRERLGGGLHAEGDGGVAVREALPLHRAHREAVLMHTAFGRWRKKEKRSEW